MHGFVRIQLAGEMQIEDYTAQILELKKSIQKRLGDCAGISIKTNFDGEGEECLREFEQMLDEVPDQKEVSSF